MSIRDYGLQRYHNIEKELEYRFRLFDKKDAKSYLNKMQRIINKSDFNEIEIIVKIKEPWKRAFFIVAERKESFPYIGKHCTKCLYGCNVYISFVFLKYVRISKSLLGVFFMFINISIYLLNPYFYTVHPIILRMILALLSK